MNDERVMQKITMHRGNSLIKARWGVGSGCLDPNLYGFFTNSGILSHCACSKNMTQSKNLGSTTSQNWLTQRARGQPSQGSPAERNKCGGGQQPLVPQEEMRLMFRQTARADHCQRCRGEGGLAETLANCQQSL